MAMPVSNHIPVLQAALKHVRATSNWIVVVTPPESKIEQGVQAALTAIRPSDSSMGGRTLLCSGGGRVTVTGGNTGVHGQGFYVMFLGFDSELTPRDQISLHSWRQNARGVVIEGEKPGELRVLKGAR